MTDFSDRFLNCYNRNFVFYVSYNNLNKAVQNFSNSVNVSLICIMLPNIFYYPSAHGVIHLISVDSRKRELPGENFLNKEHYLKKGHFFLYRNTIPKKSTFVLCLPKIF